MKSETTERPCTCHPSEAPVPCQHKYAYSDCVAAANKAAIREIADCLDDLIITIRDINPQSNRRCLDWIRERLSKAVGKLYA